MSGSLGRRTCCCGFPCVYSGCRQYRDPPMATIKVSRNDCFPISRDQLMLRRTLGHIVTSIQTLELTLTLQHQVHVRFSGRRKETTISVEGTCDLALPATATNTTPQTKPNRGMLCTVTDRYSTEQYRGIAISVTIENHDEQPWQLTDTAIILPNDLGATT